ncbi:PREDICTED: enkurin domain-containing protein 1-like [Priapulus caudatus]|uniref:Enkurin domain-containing protein 1-like n=1 Tax=Priapulus caudatus TaxID=37621 RepID=A0ABM1EYZ5_PRICU|nr:PREDICTED: enkurin domain-containing protein 1-like [Priapulus caudatus]
MIDLLLNVKLLHSRQFDINPADVTINNMALGLGGPIPPDQVLFTQQPSINDIRPGGRLATEGRKIAARHKGGVLGNLLLELQGASTHPDTRNNKFNPKPKPKDQLKENVWRMRQIQQESLRRQAEANKPVKALWKSQKYNDVPPRVGDYEKEPPSVPRSESARNYLRAHSRPGTPDPVRPRWASPHPAETDQRKRENGLAPRSNRGNDEPIAAQKPTRQPSLQRCVSVERLALNGPKTTTDDKPQCADAEETMLVQKYAEAEELPAVVTFKNPGPADACSVGLTSRAHTSPCLAAESQLLTELHALPVRSDTLRARQQHVDIERKLVEIEEAIKIFSRSKVFIKIDE